MADYPEYTVEEFSDFDWMEPEEALEMYEKYIYDKLFMYMHE